MYSRNKFYLGLTLITVILFISGIYYWHEYSYLGLENPFYKPTFNTKPLLDNLREYNIKGVVIQDIHKPNNAYIDYFDTAGNFKKLLYQNLGYRVDSFMGGISTTLYKNAVGSPNSTSISLSSNLQYMIIKEINKQSGVFNDAKFVDLFDETGLTNPKSVNDLIFKKDFTVDTGSETQSCDHETALSPNGKFLAFTYGTNYASWDLRYTETNTINLSSLPFPVSELIGSDGLPKKWSYIGSGPSYDINEPLLSKPIATRYEYCKVSWTQDSRYVIFSHPANPNEYKNYDEYTAELKGSLTNNGYMSGIDFFDISSGAKGTIANMDQLPDARAYTILPLHFPDVFLIQRVDGAFVYKFKDKKVISMDKILDHLQKIVGLVY